MVSSQGFDEERKRRRAFSEAGRTRSLKRDEEPCGFAARHEPIKGESQCAPRGNPHTRMPRAQVEGIITAKRKAPTSQNAKREFQAFLARRGVKRRSRVINPET